ncbi:hypothetical protein BKA57DRAFT_468910 [Linnemannia elongata]|nr:hypothetical protein BKA57DRAFT_468910 [Linnemannia elongata]
MLTLFLVHIVESFGPRMPPLFLVLLLYYTLCLSPLSLSLLSSPSLLGLYPVSPILSVIFQHFHSLAFVSLIRTFASMPYVIVFPFDPGTLPCCYQKNHVVMRK